MNTTGLCKRSIGKVFGGFLKTLTESEIRSGIGEMLHYFFTEGIELAQQVTDQIDEIILDILAGANPPSLNILI